MNTDATKALTLDAIDPADLGISPERWAALGAELKKQSHADMESQRMDKPLPPDWYPVVVWDTADNGPDTTTVYFMATRGPKCGRYFVDTFDRQDAKDARRYADLLRAAGLPSDARPAALEDREVSALVRCVAGRTRNAITAYKREPRAE